MKTIELSEHFDFRKLIHFTLPSILGMIFTSIYGIVDGFFISNFAGSQSFAAVNLIIPFITILSPIGFMFGTGGSALISKHMGMGHHEKANEIFSLLVYLLIGVGIVLGFVGFLLVKPVAILLGATPEMLPYCITYGQINMAGLVFFMLQYAFEILLITAERPKMAMGVTIAAGMTNMMLDALFIGVLHLGVAGAAWATVIGQFIGSVVPILFFIFTKTSQLKLGKTKWNGKAVWLSCTNGASELMSTISSAIISMLYNIQLMKIAGEAGVAAFGVIMYANFIFVGIYMGFSVGISPVISFHYGAKNHRELQSLFRRCLIIIGTISVFLTILSEILAGGLSGIFVGYDAKLLSITTTGFQIYSISFIMMGFNTFGSAFFTALNNGKVSAILSFCRTLLFQAASVLILPAILGLNGIWSAIIIAEGLGIVLTVFCFIRYKDRYHYIPEQLHR